jgi:hypothetical protein
MSATHMAPGHRLASVYFCQPPRSSARPPTDTLPPPAPASSPSGVPYRRGFYGKHGKELFTIGMQAHELCWANATPAVLSNERVKSFLDRAVSEYGKKSVLYISFGCARVFFGTQIPYMSYSRQIALLPGCHAAKRAPPFRKTRTNF